MEYNATFFAQKRAFANFVLRRLQNFFVCIGLIQTPIHTLIDRIYGHVALEHSHSWHVAQCNALVATPGMCSCVCNVFD